MDLCSTSNKEIAGKTPNKRHSDTGVGIIIWICCAAAWWQTTQFKEVPKILSQNISAAFFPRLVISLVAILAGILIFKKQDYIEKKKKFIDGKTFSTAIAIIVFISLIQVIGVLPVTILISIALPLLWSEKNYLALALYAGSIPVAIYLIFVVALQLNLPWGIFER